MRLVRRANDEINETNPKESPKRERKFQNIYTANRSRHWPPPRPAPVPAPAPAPAPVG